MQLWELFVIAVGLSMDAFAVSICKGLSVQRLRWSHALTAGAWFGAFQALMPLAGWLLGTRFEGIITSVDHWVAFVLLVLIGGNMVKESRGACEALDASFAVRAMFPLAVATSIDALAVGGSPSPSSGWTTSSVPSASSAAPPLSSPPWGSRWAACSAHGSSPGRSCSAVWCSSPWG